MKEENDTVGSILRCRILSRLPGNKHLQFTFQVLEVIQQNPLTETFKVGSTFTDSKLLNSEPEPWYIKEVPTLVH